MGRVYNFSAGPAVLPEEVLKEAAEEMLDYRGTGMSVMEMSHRSKAFETIIEEAEQDLRDLMNIPDNYKVLFLQGGAHLQFSAIPQNLMKNGVADYIITGQWAKKAFKEAQKYGKAVAVASSEDKTFSCRLTTTRTTYTSARTTRSMAPNTKPCQIPREKRWWLIFPPASFLSR